MRQIKVYLEEGHYERLKKIAESKGESVSSLARRILLAYLGVASKPCEVKVRELEGKLHNYAKSVNRTFMGYKKAIENILSRIASLEKRVEELEECCYGE